LVRLVWSHRRNYDEKTLRWYWLVFAVTNSRVQTLWPHSEIGYEGFVVIRVYFPLFKNELAVQRALFWLHSIARLLEEQIYISLQNYLWLFRNCIDLCYGSVSLVSSKMVCVPVRKEMELIDRRIKNQKCWAVRWFPLFTVLLTEKWLT
jgi:hypothetical protein